jgi:hypothetical protein
MLSYTQRRAAVAYDGSRYWLSGDGTQHCPAHEKAPPRVAQRGVGCVWRTDQGSGSFRLRRPQDVGRWGDSFYAQNTSRIVRGGKGRLTPPQPSPGSPVKTTSVRASNAAPGLGR